MYNIFLNFLLQKIVKQTLASEIGRYFDNTTDDAKLWNNLLKVKVFYEDFNYEKIEETPSYSVRYDDSLQIDEGMHSQHALKQSPRE